jgi:hypothetical protein
MRSDRTLLLSSILFVAACGSPSGSRSVKVSDDEKRACAIAQENDARSYWKEQLKGIKPSWSRPELTRFMIRIRKVDPQGSIYPREGRILFEDINIYYFLYELDETFSAFVTWNPLDEHGSISISTAEVVGFPDLRDRFSPEEFDTLLLIHRSPMYAHDGFDGLSLIRAANALLNLGKGKGVRVLDSYLDLSAGIPDNVDDVGYRLFLKYHFSTKYQLSPERLLPILQLLVAHPEGVRGWKHEGPDLIEVPGVLKEVLKRSEGMFWPLFPLTLEGDFPFTVVSMATRTSSPVEEALSRFKDERIRIRSRLYSPTQNPVEAADRLIASERWKDLQVSPSQNLQEKAHVRRQAIRAIAPLLTLSPDVVLQDPFFGPSENQWTEIVEQTRQRGIRWDASRQEFVRTR